MAVLYDFSGYEFEDLVVVTTTSSLLKLPELNRAFNGVQ